MEAREAGKQKFAQMRMNRLMTRLEAGEITEEEWEIGMTKLEIDTFGVAPAAVQESAPAPPAAAPAPSKGRGRPRAGSAASKRAAAVPTPPAPVAKLHKSSSGRVIMQSKKSLGIIDVSGNDSETDLENYNL